MYRDAFFSSHRGGKIAYRDYGPPDGKPVFYFHGWPGSRLEGGLFCASAREFGLRLVAPERPGYGRSSSRQDYGWKDWVEDVGQLADELGMDRFRVMGMSGGGPHACAVSSILSRRILRCALVVPMGPLDVPGGFECMTLPQRWLIRMARMCPWAVRGLMQLGRQCLLRNPLLALKILVRSGLPPADLQALAQVENQGAFAASMQEAFQGGVQGMFDDGMRFMSTWDFDLTQIVCPVHVWHGDEDTVVPIAYGRYLAAHMPDCQADWLPGEGHFSVALHWSNDFFKFLAQE